ncbi:MAG: sulfite exporter TauE/SafE family protein [Thiobacillus sp.]|nr:sulfite exporter TauE/SafE family protein [Thiobacillus sp.]
MLRVALVFGLFGVMGTFAGARLGLLTPVVIQLGLFALVMYAAAWRMLKPAKLNPAGPAAAPADGVVATADGTVAFSHCHDFFSPCMGHIALHGISVGILTGLVGVGGGFLIVPALVLLSGILMKQAVGTSLAIVAAKSYAGFAGYMGGVPIDYALMGAFTAVTVVGSFIGTRLAGYVSQAALKKAFAWFLVAVARLHSAEERDRGRPGMNRTVAVALSFKGEGACFIKAGTLRKHGLYK